MELSHSEHITQLAELIANITEAYTVGIFLKEPNKKSLKAVGVHTLSRSFVSDCSIDFGHGLVGWTAENEVRISVCPFENDARTLVYYSEDQDLKSFIAVPVFDKEQQLIGVISCDSKKSYAFAKLTEKILVDCAAQVANIVDLSSRCQRITRKEAAPTNGQLLELLEGLRSYQSEKELLTATAQLPEDLIPRDALVVMTTAEGGVGAGTFYASSREEQAGNRLLDLVCKHKKVICSERSVHVLPTNDTKERSFLSVPFHVLGVEAGSLNCLSKSRVSFNADEIQVLERVAKVVSRELERIRLVDAHKDKAGENASLSWKHFAIKARTRLREAAKARQGLTLLRVELSDPLELEAHLGIEQGLAAQTNISRLVAQVSRPPALSCSLSGHQAFILAERNEAALLGSRLVHLVRRLENEQFASAPKNLLSDSICITQAQFPGDGDTLEVLIGKTRSLLQSQEDSSSEDVAHAGNW